MAKIPINMRHKSSQYAYNCGCRANSISICEILLGVPLNGTSSTISREMFTSTMEMYVLNQIGCIV